MKLICNLNSIYYMNFQNMKYDYSKLNLKMWVKYYINKIYKKFHKYSEFLEIKYVKHLINQAIVFFMILDA